MKALTLLFFVFGCGSDVHVLDGTDAGEPTTDSGARVDAGSPGVDAGGPDGGPTRDDYFWRLVPADVDFQVTPEMCDSHEGVDKRFGVMHHWFSSCQEPGPIQIELDEAARTVAIQGWNWELVGPSDCRAIGAAVPRHAFVEGLSNGTWTVTWARGSVEIDVGGAPPPITCVEPGPAGSSCLADCDCTEGRCVEPSNDAVCGARTCQRICNAWLDTPGFHPECPSGLECAPDPVFGSTCQTPRSDLCSTPSDCPAGTRCESDSDAVNHCVWDVSAGPLSSPPCASNEDCVPGLDCVESSDGTTRSCDVRCRTAEQVCPSGERCGEGFSTRAWVCPGPIK
jgi:hypothetical protein